MSTRVGAVAAAVWVAAAAAPGQASQRAWDASVAASGTDYSQFDDTSWSLVRVEAGSLLLKYPGPAIAKDHGVFDDALWSHNLRLGVSVGLRF